MKNKKHIKILLSGGGTGGHVFPAIAIADALRKQLHHAEFLFIGAKNKIEMTAVPKAGYKIEGLNIAGFQRSLSAKNISFPFKLLASLYKSWRIISKFKPDVAIGTGGYASGAALKIAQLKGIPTYVQEQNALPGITNKLLGKKVTKVFAAYEGLEKYFDSSKIIITGNPLRNSISLNGLKKQESIEHFGLNINQKVVFITGGSLGALAINKAIAKNIEELKHHNIQLIWQCGKGYLSDYKKYESKTIKVLDFIDRMDFAYTAADIIVSRAGGTISELAIIGKPAILLPSPNVAEDHQTKNVEALVKKDAAIMVRDTEANDQLGKEIIELLGNENLQQKLAKNIKSFAKPDAAKIIASTIIKDLDL